MPSPTQRALARVPQPLRPLLLRHRRLVKFLLVGGFCFLLTVVIDFELKFTVLEHKPVVALTVATVIGTVVSYVLNRRWAFRTGWRRREPLLFGLVSAVAIAVNDLPLIASRYLLDLREPYVGPLAQEVADFVSGMLVGTFVAMLFRFWAVQRWVFTTPPSPQGEGGYAASEVPGMSEM
ncbi:GtrA family protein [Streptomyces sp. NRRL WC-3742]|uniref:GtrA family protein n=1 Tax=Streptomyces sp. NRRL WC-3742 TaxID=1463934 RepID=UPI00068E892C|nr:GtrA family protein [Streptomyces sp. NRRL WC-3742]